MDFSSEGREISTVAGEAADVVRLVRDWRSQVPRQWPRTRWELSPSRVQAILEAWEAAGGDRRLVLLAVLGSEWLLRARPATNTDVEAEVGRIRTALLRGIPNPNVAVLVEQLAGQQLRSVLKKCRFLVPFGTWAIPSAEIVMQLARAHHGQMDRAEIKPDMAVTLRPGRIPKLGPIVAGILVEGIAQRSATLSSRSEEFGLSVVRLLRNVRPAEFRKWRRYLDRLDSGPETSSPQSERRTTYRQWLVARYERHFQSMSSLLGDWEDFCGEAQNNPTFLFACVGDARVAQDLFSVPWA